MATVLGTHVPEDSAKPHMEICHAFVYRWLIACGLYKGNLPVDPMTGDFSGDVMKPVLWPIAGKPARVGGKLQTKRGDIVSFFNGNDLVHSMVVVDVATWYGANNAGAFGVQTGRSQIDNVNGGFPGRDLPAATRLGWVNDSDNTWRAMGGAVLTVVYRTPAARDFGGAGSSSSSSSSS